MKRVAIKEQSLVNLGNAIREKAGTTTKYDIDEAVEVVKGLGTPELEELTATENKEYIPEKYGYSKVTVNVQPELEELSVSANGEYFPTTYGYSKVSVDVKPELEELTATSNGVYEPTKDGFSKVTVDTPPGLSEEVFSITGNCTYRFSYNGWNWFIEQYGDKITTSDIVAADYMFSYSTNLEEIPFDINCSSVISTGAVGMLRGCGDLESAPIIRGKLSAINGLFENCQRLRYIPEEVYSGIDWSLIDGATGQYDGSMSSIFSGCYSLRQLPMGILSHGNKNARYTYNIYYSMCADCYALDEIVDLPFPHPNTTATSSMLSNTVQRCYRLKEFTFALDNGVPYTAKWKSQTLDLTAIGFAPYEGYVTPYNSGITEDKKVVDDTTYQALKNDLDWYTTEAEYSRYNHDSAVNTINSLPDTSAYLSTAGGTNTIKFVGKAGSLTDGGAINTLTEEEIAVATAKGWTVALS